VHRLQVWHFLGSFYGMLGLAAVPSFSALEAALAGGTAAAREPLLRVAVPLTRLLVADVYHVASEELVEPEGNEAAQQRDLQVGSPLVTEQNWTHAAGAVFAGVRTDACSPEPPYPTHGCQPDRRPHTTQCLMVRPVRSCWKPWHHESVGLGGSGAVSTVAGRLEIVVAGRDSSVVVAR